MRWIGVDTSVGRRIIQSMPQGLNADERRAYLSIAERRAKDGSGTHARVLRERTSRYGIPPIKPHLGNVPFVVVGGVATRLYMPERMTLDIDVLVSASRLGDAEDALERSGCVKLGPLTVGGSTWRLPEGATLDVLALSEPWADAAVGNPVSTAEGLPCVDLRFLVLMKLVSGRVQDLADITRMLGACDDEAWQAIQDVARRWRPQDVEDVESMRRLGRLEYADE
jgi:hypothetical protein